MKTNLPLMVVLCMIVMLLCSQCGTQDIIRQCQLKKFTWYHQNFNCYYNSVGRLSRLVADTTKILFYYNRAGKLDSASFFGEDSRHPLHRYIFTQGLYGIAQVDHYAGGEHVRESFHYASAKQIDQALTEEFYNGVVTESRRHYFTYVNWNLTVSNAFSSDLHSVWQAKYDGEHNPFKDLAKAVGNDLFFPIGLYTYYIVGQFDIGYGSRFSANNPVDASYELVGTGVDPTLETFTQTFDGVIVTGIHRVDDSYTVEDYGFEYNCGGANTELL